MSTTIKSLSETHWHASDLKAWENVTSAIPKVIETELALWNLRVNRPAQTPHLRHRYLMAVSALRYEMRDGAFRPVEPAQEMHFLVVAENSRAAYKRIEDELSAHGYNRGEWAIGSDAAPMVLV